jgi:hypothetical protein
VQEKEKAVGVPELQPLDCSLRGIESGIEEEPIDESCSSCYFDEEKEQRLLSLLLLLKLKKKKRVVQKQWVKLAHQLKMPWRMILMFDAV